MQAMTYDLLHVDNDVCRSLCLSVCLSVCLFRCLFVSLSLRVTLFLLALYSSIIFIW